ncbi:zf-HC2 domain-containing protein [Nocardioides sambongensis]|uniref:zf-HC2 domain-containing protein n=1 Tax=Nocardioides sambongensis TaxID=2589074 RepID=UPI00112A4657|nr:zf-HC2 domain-containing protein [Nocardioides sambongensis]
MTTTTGWHASPGLLSAYVDGALDAVLSASLERHVDHCPECRAAAGVLVDRTLLDTAWDQVRSTAERPRLRLPARLVRALGLSEPTAILLGAAASLRASWMSSAVVALAFATLATLTTDSTTLWPFLLVAPLIPVLGVAGCYPATEESFDALAVSTPYGRTRLILVRTVAVLVSVLPVTVLLGTLLPGPLWVAAAWMGPALALVPVMMALASFTGPRMAVAVVALAWSAVVLTPVRSLDATWPVELQQQLGYLALAAVALLVLGLRSRSTGQIGAAL